VEKREKAHKQEAATKQRAFRKYNSKLHPRLFRKGDPVWQMASCARKYGSKFSANWEWPFQVLEDINKGIYKLEMLFGGPVSSTWNVSYLKFYFN